ncbi:MAG: hypothetical protein V8S34_08785 [Lawsonibacter sp.]
MIVDIHTHTFPQAIAAATIEKLAAMSHTPFTDGSNAELAASMAQAGVDRSIVLPVATNPARSATSTTPPPSQRGLRPDGHLLLRLDAPRRPQLEGGALPGGAPGAEGRQAPPGLPGGGF